ncbi:MAG: penicillin acylase family protein [Mycobacteriales bacterium]
MTGSSRRRRLTRCANVAASAVAFATVLLLSISGAGTVPALGQTLSSAGVWHLSPSAGTANNREVHLSALSRPATVTFESDGTPHVSAATDGDLFAITGYLHGQYRLTQMDLARRQAQGRLSQILGPAALEGDRFELELGLQRAAQREWDSLLADDPERSALISYAKGVNAAIGELTRTHRLPPTFALLGYRPATWTPVDSLVIQRSMTQTLSFTDFPVTFSYLADAVPRSVFREWLPNVSANPQHPWDPGPYRRLPLSRLPVRADAASGARSVTQPVAGRSTTGPRLAGLAHRLEALPKGFVHDFGNSNAWAIAPSRTRSGGALLASDPHLQLTLPSVWYQVAARSPGYHYAGATIPGLPVPLVGTTDSFSWGVANSQHPQTLFYLEKADKADRTRYFHDGTWKRMTERTYVIPVKGAAADKHTVRFTEHGPVLTMQGVTASVWWAGALPSHNIRGVLSMLKATDFASFRAALRDWTTPAMDFVYADRHGHIGATNAGTSPQVRSGDATLPLPGDGSADVIGAVPFDALPHTLDPPSGFVVAANQREVTAAYPYQYGTSYGFFDQGWRAASITHRLSGVRDATYDQSRLLQTDIHDELARELMPYALKALNGTHQTGAAATMLAGLRTWDLRMSTDSPQATFFAKYVNHVVWLTIEPWWRHYKVPSDPDGNMPPSEYGGSVATEVLRGTVLSWVKDDPHSKWFSEPDGTLRSADAILRQAYTETIAELSTKQGADPSAWRYGKNHFMLIPSLLQVPAFDYGPVSSGGNGRTIDAAVGALFRDGKPVLNTTTGGPSWRQVVDWGSGQRGAIYPGGQSESPLSPWYRDRVPGWIDGQLTPLTDSPAHPIATWRLRP